MIKTEHVESEVAELFDLLQFGNQERGGCVCVYGTMTQPQVSAKDGTCAVYAFTSAIRTRHTYSEFQTASSTMHLQ
jgi:hypothetical protein